VSAIAGEDTMLVELRGLTTLREANARDLALRIPREVRTEPFDPRELLPGGESR
jgi:hypothetical protein